tara:strand:+ start:96 stop:932 length:837 start_codon:yes stop_codon:yes gene_type:complete
MKTPYIYFGTKGYFNTPGVAPTSGVADLATMTIANSGLLPASKATSVDPTTLGYRVVHRAVDAVDDKRGTDYTNDFITQALFASATAWDADKNADDIQANQVTNLTSAAAYTSGSANGVVTVGDNTATGAVGSVAAGITMTTNDIVVVEQFKRNDAPGNGAAAGQLSSCYAYPMTGFRGADPIAYAKTHYDGTALDQTNLHFESTDGTATDDIITIIHTAGKFPDIVKTMEAIANCGVYHRAITFYDLDINGTETFAGGPSLSGANDLGIVGIFRTTA